MVAPAMGHAAMPSRRNIVTADLGAMVQNSPSPIRSLVSCSELDLDPDPNLLSLSPEQFLNVMTEMIPGAWKNQFLPAQVSDPETGTRRKGGFFAQEKKRLPCQRSLIDTVYNPLGVMNEDSGIYKPLSKLLMQQGVKTVDDAKTYTRHVSSDIGNQRRRNRAVQRCRHADGDLAG